MEKNEFIPPGLPLLADYALLKTTVEYRHVVSILKGDASPGSKRIRTKVEQALQMIENELCARDLNPQVSHASKVGIPNTAKNSRAYAL